MEKTRTNIYISKETFKKFKILCIMEDKSVSAKIDEYIAKAVEDESKKQSI